MEYVLGPTPVKSRRSITSACWEPFLGRDLPPLALGFSWMASSELDLRPVGFGATAGWVLRGCEGEIRATESRRRTWWSHCAMALCARWTRGDT